MLYQAQASERVDLSEDSAFFLELLDNTRTWRERQVRELRFGNRNHVRAVSSYQIDFPPALLDRHKETRKARRANVLIPLTTRGKQPLLNFSLSGPGGSPATLTSRVSIAALEAEYLQFLMESSAVSATLSSAIDSQLFESISVFTPGFFRDNFFLKDGDGVPLKDGDGDMADALARYLSDGLGWPVAVKDVQRWRQKTSEVGKVLATRLQEPVDEMSSSEEILLALPCNPRPPQSTQDIDILVDGFHRAVLTADRASDDPFLVAIAEYGRRYEVVVEVELPLLEPSRVKIEEDLPVELERRLERRGFRYWIGQDFPLGDARSAHLEARSDDPNIEVSGYEVKDLHGQDASGWLETIRHTREALAVYGSDPDRPYFATIWVRLGVARPLMVAAWLLSAANVLAIAAVFVVGLDDSAGDRLAVLAIPTTIAATFALVREQTALAARLQQLSRMFLTLTTGILWLAVVISLIVLDGNSAKGSSTSHPGHEPQLIGGRGLPSTMEDGNGKGAKRGKEWITRQRADWRGEGS